MRGECPAPQANFRVLFWMVCGEHTPGSYIGGFMASGAKNQLPLVNDLGAPTLRDGSVGRWDGNESFFSDGFDVGGHP